MKGKRIFWPRKTDVQRNQSKAGKTPLNKNKITKITTRHTSAIILYQPLDPHTRPLLKFKLGQNESRFLIISGRAVLISAENKRKSFTDGKVSLLCIKDSKYSFKNNAECCKQCKGRNYVHDRWTITSMTGQLIMAASCGPPGSDCLSVALIRNDTHTAAFMLHCNKMPLGKHKESGILQGLTHQFLKAPCNFLNIVND